MKVHIFLLWAQALLGSRDRLLLSCLHGDHFLHHFTLIHIISLGCPLHSVHISKLEAHLLQRTPYLTSQSFPLCLISIAFVAAQVVLSDRCPSIPSVYHISFCKPVFGFVSSSKGLLPWVRGALSFLLSLFQFHMKHLFTPCKFLMFRIHMGESRQSLLYVCYMVSWHSSES